MIYRCASIFLAALVLCLSPTLQEETGTQPGIRRLIGAMSESYPN